MTIVEQGSGPVPQAPSDLIKETTTQTFVKDVIEESKRQSLNVRRLPDIPPGHRCLLG